MMQQKISDAERAVEIKNTGGDSFAKMIKRTNKSHSLHMHSIHIS